VIFSGDLEKGTSSAVAAKKMQAIDDKGLLKILHLKLSGHGTVDALHVLQVILKDRHPSVVIGSPVRQGFLALHFSCWPAGSEG